MSEILSQNEVDSLLSGLDAGKVETENVSKEFDDIVPYDFTSQEKVLGGRMPTLQVINDRLAGEMNNSLSNMLLANADINASSMETLKFYEFGRLLPVPASLHVFRMNPLRGYALLVLESQLVFNLINTFFGGHGSEKAKVEGREFTSIEYLMIKKIVLAFLKDLEASWASVEPIKTVFIRSEVNPQFATIVPPNDPVIVSTFEVDLEQTAGTITVCLPYSMIEPIRSKLTAGFQSDKLDVDFTWQDHLKEIILNSMIEFSVQLGTTEIIGKNLIHLKPGDVIQLDQDAREKLIGFVEGMPKFAGYAGTQRKFQAFQINDKLKQE